MAKRLTDTDKWLKIWFRKLSPIKKCFWDYITDNCDHAGIWEVDFETAGHFIGGEINSDEIKEAFAKQIIEFADGKRWYIKDFIEFQYSCTINELNPKNKLHASVIKLLQKHNIYELVEGVNKGLSSPLQGVKDRNKNINKNKDKDKEKEGGVGETKPPEESEEPVKTEYFEAHFHQCLPVEFLETWRKYINHQTEAGVKINRHNVMSHLKAFKECYQNGISPPELLEAFQQSSHKGLYWISKNLIKEKEDGKNNSDSRSTKQSGSRYRKPVGEFDITGDNEYHYETFKQK